ncbi:MAG TPA: PQQ-binding-like beta-propeller repeat protein [Pyrinomonadaceae bacterium]|nr:PQQ-binding-like beta-propeller repeat protein [Pyrinomonadaceae bacterium]
MRTRLHFFVAVLAASLVLASCGRVERRTILSAPPATTLDNDIYLAEEGGRIRALRPDGSEQWSYSLADDLERLTNQPSRDIRIDYLAARSGGHVFGLATRLAGRESGVSILFALEGNKLIWQREVSYPVQTVAPIAIGKDAVYEACEDGVLYAYARDDGRTLWQYRVSEAAIGSPTVGGDGTIYVTGPRQNLHAVAPDGTQRWVTGAQK